VCARAINWVLDGLWAVGDEGQEARQGGRRSICTLVGEENRAQGQADDDSL
jgi:hypothetical protein